MWKSIAIITGLAVTAVLVYAAMRPDTFQVARSTVIKAAPDKIFPLINDLRAMNTWRPFVKTDPDIRLVYSGPASGPGARHTFEGNSKAGTGDLEITEAVAPSRIVLALHMIKPMEARNRIDFTLEPKADGTKVTWAMRGDQPFIGKLIGVLMNMDSMVGGAFEMGLRDLKEKTEG